jgi:branched-chain amino acid transport system ATP-binding protein
VANVVLTMENVTLAFGGLKAVSDLSLTLQRGELAGLIGPNGAGKTTVFNILSGIYQPQQGLVRAFDRDVLGLKPHQVCGLGLVRTFQNIRLFKEMSVEDNIKVGFHHEKPYGHFSALADSSACCDAEARLDRRCSALLDTLQLGRRRRETAGSLPYGEQKKVEIARAVATGAKILLLDEPAAGMNPGESKWLMDIILKIRKDFDLSILLIEHDMKVVMGICDRIHVMDHGQKIAEGKAHEIQKNKKVIEAYLGTGKA